MTNPSFRVGIKILFHCSAAWKQLSYTFISSAWEEMEYFSTTGRFILSRQPSAVTLRKQFCLPLKIYCKRCYIALFYHYIGILTCLCLNLVYMMSSKLAHFWVTIQKVIWLEENSNQSVNGVLTLTFQCWGGQFAMPPISNSQKHQLRAWEFNSVLNSETSCVEIPSDSKGWGLSSNMTLHTCYYHFRCQFQA